jgi:hypothetical protein
MRQLFYELRPHPAHHRFGDILLLTFQVEQLEIGDIEYRGNGTRTFLPPAFDSSGLRTSRMNIGSLRNSRSHTCCGLAAAVTFFNTGCLRDDGFSNLNCSLSVL